MECKFVSNDVECILGELIDTLWNVNMLDHISDDEHNRN